MLRQLFLLILLPVATFAQQRPNIIYIMSDDHDADAISAYNKNFISTPHIDRLAKEGMLFKNCFVGNSICSPVRATVLTGQHSHMNGVKDNRTRFDSSKVTLPKLLRQAGYETAIIGKWHLHSLPAGFDYFKVYPGQGAYFSPRLIHTNNDTILYKGYSTNVITDEALQWLREKRNPSKPFFLMFHHKAPHRNFLPDLDQLEKFSKIKFPEPPTLFADSTGKGSAFRHQRMSILNDMTLCTDLKIDPAFIKDIPHLKPTEQEERGYHFIINSIPEEKRARMKEIFDERGKLLRQIKPSGKELLRLKYQWYLQDYMACVASVDESIGQILNYLDASGLSENTIVIYTSDQGFYLGENGWFDKRFMYDVSMQTPLIVKWKTKINAGSVNNALVQNIDFAPTVLAMAGEKIPAWMQGINLLPLLTGKQKETNRKNLYYHYYEYPIDHYVLPHLGIREKRYKLIYFYTVNEWELYDLEKDPAEQNNLAGSSKHAAILWAMKRRLAEERNKYGDHAPAGEFK